VALVKGNHGIFRAGDQLYTRASGHARFFGGLVLTAEIASLFPVLSSVYTQFCFVCLSFFFFFSFSCSAPCRCNYSEASALLGMAWFMATDCNGYATRCPGRARDTPLYNGVR
jgi:hypothetical protein